MTSSNHELTAALSEDKAAMVSDAHSEAFDVNIRAQRPREPFTLLVLGELTLLKRMWF